MGRKCGVRYDAGCLPAFETNKSLNDWLLQYAGDDDDDQTIRSTLGKLLFSGVCK